MKRKYLALLLSLTMTFTAVSPVMASSDETQVVEEVSEDMLSEQPVSTETEVFLSLENDSEMNVDEEENSEISQFSSDFDAEDFNDGSENGSTVDTGETTADGWTTLEKESSISFKYDESNKTLYFKCSGTAALPDNNQSGSTAQWALALKDKTKEVETVEIGEGITRIGAFNFNNKLGDYPNLKTVKLSSTVTTIGDSAFEKDSNLKEINLNQIECVEIRGLKETGIEQAVFDKEQVEIGENAFNNCTSLKNVTVKGISNWGEYSFMGCQNLVSFQCEKPIAEIPDSTFLRCSALTSCNITGVENVIFSAFEGCASLTTFDFSNVKVLKASAFEGAGLTQIAFNNKDITMGRSALACENLKSICYPGTAEEWGTVSKKADLPDTAVVHCKADTVEAKAATCTEDGWKEVGVCEVCGEHYSYPTDENVIPATGHTWSEDYVVDKEATCTETGEKSKHCTVCDAKEDVQEIPALGHDFVSKVTKKATCTADGTLTYTCSRCNETKTETIKATGHKWSNWKRTTAATVFKPEVQTRKCSACNKSETRNVGKKLAPKATLNASTVTLKVKQSTSGLKVTGLAKGDSVKSWKSSNSKIFTVSGKSNGTCKITGKKSGTAKLQITLASGLKKTVKVKVQTAAVKTSKITVSKNVTVQKGKRVTLKPVVTPFTSSQKVTYTSSNKKIATVSSKGVVTGKKKGTVKITVKSGSKSVKVTVKVK
ncbi:leucine-rich repeat protein [Blautia sp. MSJ-19]|uniref:leucine-rich repeat protein n=1 Tax=Blautia sp. MSJ-19 TaxID=2841517 RepID=UPI001C0F2F15|nr:leucine-rich repeat protein [Blautia sp. MSJ-19]MBU5479880.1 leucine-rich repeat protein [Blautia sp. MSJ-19]